MNPLNRLFAGSGDRVISRVVNNITVQGQRTALRRVPSGGGNYSFDLLTPVQLIAAGELEPGPWVVTFDSLYTVTSPWPAPAQSLDVTGRPRVMMSMGAAGLRRVVEFDYPSAGGVVAVNTAALDVMVRATAAEPSSSSAPVNVGAWLTPGSPSLRTVPTLAMDDSVNAADIAPFARNLVLSAYNTAGNVPAGEWRVKFEDVSGLVFWRYQVPGPYARLEVPPLAVRVQWTYSVAANWSNWWEIGLA